MVKFLKRLFGSKDADFESVRQQMITLAEAQKDPWACFEVVSIEDGRVKVKFNWNDMFLTEIKKMGFEGETPEDIVQLFFYTSKMLPEELDELNELEHQ